MSVKLGRLSAGDMGKSAHLDSSSLLHAYMGRKAEAKGRHPATPRGRKQEFIGQAKAHMEQQAHNMQENSAIRANKTSDAPEGRWASFYENASMN